jgi:hypothetical protein
MWWKRKKPAPPDTSEAVAAQKRAREVIENLGTQTDEIKQIVTSLDTRGVKNNFGRALEIAMELRGK